MQIPRIDPRNAAGLSDKVVGVAREVLGTLIGQDQLSEAGRKQQEKGAERLKAIQAELRADAHEAQAKSAAGRQQSAQKTKETVNS